MQVHASRDCLGLKAKGQPAHKSKQNRGALFGSPGSMPPICSSGRSPKWKRRTAETTGFSRKAPAPVARLNSGAAEPQPCEEAASSPSPGAPGQETFQMAEGCFLQFSGPASERHGCAKHQTWAGWALPGRCFKPPGHGSGGMVGASKSWSCVWGPFPGV